MPPPPEKQDLTINLPPTYTSTASTTDGSPTILTPTESTSSTPGPHYDDLPPSYDEAQRDVSMVPRRSRGGAGDAGTVPVTYEHVDRSEKGSSVGHGVGMGKGVGTREDMVGQDDGMDEESVSQILSAAFEFMEVGGAVAFDGDMMGMMLEKCVGVPCDFGVREGKGKERAKSKYERKKEKKETRMERKEMKKEYKEWKRGLSPSESRTVGDEQQTHHPNQKPYFLRATASILSTHAIPAPTFLAFIDTLNTLYSLSPPPHQSTIPPALVIRFLTTANAIFFAPRGLKVSIQTLPSLLDTARIPNERHLRDGIIHTVLASPGAEQSAQALIPWIERLEVSREGEGVNVGALRGMMQRLGLGRENESTAENASTAGREGVRGSSAAQDPPHSIPAAYPGDTGIETPAGSSHSNWRHRRGGWRGRGCGRGRGGRGAFGSFGPPSHGPFGAPGNGPFGPPGHGPFGTRGRGAGFFNNNRGFHRGPGGGQNNEWSAWGQEYGKRMEEWGQQFGKRMEEWGNNVGKRAEEWGNDLARKTSESFGQTGVRGQQYGVGIGSEGSANARGQGPLWQGQESGVIMGEKSSWEKAVAEKGEKSGMMKGHSNDDEDDDASSISSSDSSSSSSDDDDDDDDDEDADPEKAFLARLDSINATADAALSKGKQDPTVIERERLSAIEKAQKQRSRREVSREFRARKKELKREWVGKRKEFRRRGVGKKNGEWREGKKGYREERARLKEWKGVRRELKRGVGVVGEERELGQMLWIVVENAE